MTEITSKLSSDRIKYVFFNLLSTTKNIFYSSSLFLSALSDLSYFAILSCSYLVFLARSLISKTSMKVHL